MDKRAKRLIVFAPEEFYPWSDMSEDFDYTALFPISAIKEYSTEFISEIISNMI